MGRPAEHPGADRPNHLEERSQGKHGPAQIERSVGGEEQEQEAGRGQQGDPRQHQGVGRGDIAPGREFPPEEPGEEASQAAIDQGLDEDSRQHRRIQAGSPAAGQQEGCKEGGAGNGRIRQEVPGPVGQLIHAKAPYLRRPNRSSGPVAQVSRSLNDRPRAIRL